VTTQPHRAEGGTNTHVVHVAMVAPAASLALTATASANVPVHHRGTASAMIVE
jgi:hypothetical protein